MRVLGIDPGLARVGFGIVDKNGDKLEKVVYGCISSRAGEKVSARLKKIYDSIINLIETYSPDLVAVEDIFFNKNVKSALLVGQARGVVILAGVNSGIDVLEYTPLAVKQALVGYGRAEKTQINYMVKKLLRIHEPVTPDDAADGLAIAICCLHSYQKNIQR